MMRSKLSFLFVFLFIFSRPVLGAEISIGMYYYGGWSPTYGLFAPTPWRHIQLYPDREPLLGWYNDEKMETLNQQLIWMADYKVDFVAFAWYWYKGVPRPETAVRAYLNAPSRVRIRYALLWANHFKDAPGSLKEWDEMIEYWLNRHLVNPEYLQIDGKPVIFIFSADFFREHAKTIGLEPAGMLERAREAARAKGLKGIYFVLCVVATDYWVEIFAPVSGVDALTAYNYHFGVAGNLKTMTRFSQSYSELDNGYQMQWKWILSHSKIPYFVPMSSGWDKRPWGGSKEPFHDNSMSTPDEFERHLRAGYELITRNPEKTKNIGMLCCWNEYGEGSIIEPTKHHGFEYLNRVYKVFKRKK